MTARSRPVAHLLAGLVVAALSGGAWAKGLEAFTLTRAIPADAFLVIHTRDHEGRAFLRQQCERVWKAVEDAHFERDLRRVIRAAAGPEGESPEFEQRWQQLADLLAGVQWSTLGQREYALALKLGVPLPEFVALMMPPAERVQTDFEGLGAILRALADLAPEHLDFTQDTQGDSPVQRLSVAQAPFPIVLTLARVQDTILVGLGTGMVEQSLSMLRGGSGQTLASTERFRNALASLPAPTDGLTYIDVARLMDQIRALIGSFQEQVSRAAPPAGEEEEEEEDGAGGDSRAGPALALRIVGKLIDALDMWEYCAAVTTTSGQRMTQDTLCVLKDSARNSPLYAAFYGNPPLSEPLRYVPRTAGEFSVTSGIDFLALYRAIVQFVEDNVPDGAQHIAQFKEKLAEAGIDIEADVLSWIEGRLTTFSIPGPTPFAPGEFAILVSVRDESKAREMIDRAFEALEPILANQGGTVSPAEIAGTEGFRSVVAPMLAMIPGAPRSPTIGVARGWLFLASSPEVITSSLEAADKGENFATNERYQKEGLPPGKNVVALSFSDLTHFGEQLGQALKMANMMGGLMGGGARNPAAAHILRMISKLGRVADELNFFQSASSLTTREGNRLLTRTVTNYREPPPRTAPPRPAEPEPGQTPPGTRDKPRDEGR